MNIERRYNESIAILDVMKQTQKDLEFSKLDNENKKYILLQLKIVAYFLNCFNKTVDHLESEIESLKNKITVLESDIKYNNNETNLAVDKICNLRDELINLKKSYENQQYSLEELTSHVQVINDYVASFFIEDEDDDFQVLEFQAKL